MITITVQLESVEEAERISRMFEAYASYEKNPRTAPFAAQVLAQEAQHLQTPHLGASELFTWPIVLRPVAPQPSQTTEDAGQADAHAGVDARGIPWDERIHSSNRKRVAGGVWQRRRNTSDELVAQVEATLGATGAVEVPTVAEVPDPTVIPPVPAVPPVPVDPRAHWPKSASELMPLLVKGMSSGDFSIDRLNAACQAVGVENVNGFNSRPDLIPALIEELDLVIGA